MYKMLQLLCYSIFMIKYYEREKKDRKKTIKRETWQNTLHDKQFCHNKIQDTKTGPQKPKGERGWGRLGMLQPPPSPADFC